MVCNWKPNSSRDLKEHRMPDSVEGPSIVDHSDDSGPDDININAADYQLLPSDMIPGIDPQHHMHNALSDSSDSDEESDDSDDAYNGPRAIISAVIQQEQPDDDVIPSSSDNILSQSNQLETQSVQHRLEGWERTEISVNSDEIRSIMSGFHLPDSAVPDWASAVPEADFSSFVWDRIKSKET